MNTQEITTKALALVSSQVILPEKEDGWPHFCLISVAIEEIEMLQLHRDGNTRCRLLRSPAGWRKAWIAP